MGSVEEAAGDAGGVRHGRWRAVCGQACERALAGGMGTARSHRREGALPRGVHVRSTLRCPSGQRLAGLHVHRAAARVCLPPEVARGRKVARRKTFRRLHQIGKSGLRADKLWGGSGAGPHLWFWLGDDLTGKKLQVPQWETKLGLLAHVQQRFLGEVKMHLVQSANGCRG